MWSDKCIHDFFPQTKKRKVNIFYLKKKRWKKKIAKFDDSLSVFLVIYIIEKLSRLIKRTRTPRKGELLIFFSFFFSLSFGLAFIIIIIFFCCYSQWCVLDGASFVISFYTLLFRKCVLQKNKKKEEDRVLLPFFMCLCVCVSNWSWGWKTRCYKHTGDSVNRLLVVSMMSNQQASAS